MEMKYFDIHSHLYFPEYDLDRQEVISNMKEKGIWTTTIGTSIETSKKAIELAEKNENIFASIGLHPAHYSDSFWSDEFNIMVKNPKVVCIGECGFDYFRVEGDLENIKNIQTDLFEKQIRLAVENNKSLMLHCRPSKNSMDAYIDAIEILKKYKMEFGEKLFGNFHFFAGNIDILRQIFDLGFTVSFTGVITFVKDYNDLVSFTPIESLHTETDSPFVAPNPYRGKRNSPEYVVEVVRKIAEIKNIDQSKLEEGLIKNARKLFKI